MVGEEVREKVGRLFVGLTAEIFGGETSRNGTNDSEIGNPDILNWERDQAYESKASISSDHHKIKPKQIEHYRKLLESEFPLSSPEVYFFLWQHKKRGVSQFSGNDLEKNLIKGINRLLVVSFDIIEAGTEVWQTTGRNSWGIQYMFRSSERANLTKHPDQELERMGLNPRDYRIERETIPEKQYKYKWWDLPEFNITYILRKGMRGLERT
ncbi:MAG: hypothetical protein AABX54_01920 [Nanoarchaeota archaeon]